MNDVTPSVLAVGASLANLARAKAVNQVSNLASITEVTDSLRAIDCLRVAKFDLIAVGPMSTLQTSDQVSPGSGMYEAVDTAWAADQANESCHRNPMTAWQFISKVRKAWPWQKWVYVSSVLSENEEVLARSLGAVAVLDGPDAWTEIVDIALRVKTRQPVSEKSGNAPDYCVVAATN